MTAEHSDEGPAAARARRELRRHYAGTLVFDAGVCPTRFVADPGVRRLLLPLEPAAASLTDATLHVPEEREGALQVLITLSAADPSTGEAGALADRWGAYHCGAGRAGPQKMQPRWAWGRIEATRIANEVVSGEDLADAPPAPDALRAAEPRLCRHLNADRGALGRICRALAGVEVEQPVAVGVDPEGIDVRARFGIVRLEFDEAALDEAGAMERIAALFARGGAA